MSHSWQSSETPEYDEMTTIPIPSGDVVRNVAGNARSLDVEDDRVSVNTHGLAPAEPVLHTLLFDVNPPHPQIINGKVVFTVAEPLDVEGRENDGIQSIRVKADERTHEVESVEIRAAIA